MKIINVMASSLDGRIAAYPQETDDERRRYGFIVPEDQKLLLDELYGADAVITGGNSLRVTRTVADAFNAKNKIPTWLIFSNHPQNFDEKFWHQTHVERVIVSKHPVHLPQDVQSQASLKLKHYGDEHPATFVHQFLKARGCETVLLFGGGEINRLFYEKGLVDELKLTLCPFLFGGLNAPHLVSPGPHLQAKFTLLASHHIRSHVFLHYRVH